MEAFDRIPSFGFARGAVVRLHRGGPNMIVVRGLASTTACVFCDGDAGATLRMLEFQTADLRQVLPSSQIETSIEPDACQPIAATSGDQAQTAPGASAPEPAAVPSAASNGHERPLTRDG